MKTKTSNDYEKEYHELVDSLKNITNDIQNKLLKLSIAHPDLIIDYVNDIPIKANSISNINYIRNLPVTKCISYIRKFE